MFQLTSLAAQMLPEPMEAGALTEKVQETPKLLLLRKAEYYLSGKAFHEMLTQDDLAAIYKDHLGNLLPKNEGDGFFGGTRVWIVKYELSDGRTIEIANTGLTRIQNNGEKQSIFVEGPGITLDSLYSGLNINLLITSENRVFFLTPWAFKRESGRKLSLKIVAHELIDQKIQPRFEVLDLEQGVKGLRVTGPIEMKTIELKDGNWMVLLDSSTYHSNPTTVAMVITPKGDIVRKADKALSIQPSEVSLVSVNNVEYIKIFGPTSYNGNDVDRREDYNIQTIDLNLNPISISDMGWNFHGGQIFHQKNGVSYAYIYKNGFSGYKWYKVQLDGTTSKIDAAEVPIEHRRSVTVR